MTAQSAKQSPLIPQKSGPALEPANGKADSLIVILHGYGADAQDLFPLSYAWREALPQSVFVALNAPFPCEANPMGKQWFSLFDLDASNRAGVLTYLPVDQLVSGADEAVRILNQWIDELLETYRLPPEKLALVGFSQGAMLALQIGLFRTPQIGAIAAFSGRLLQPEKLVGTLPAKPPVLLRHGDQDSVVPSMNLTIAEGTLKGLGVSVDAKLETDLDHGISDSGVDDAAKFLKQSLRV